MPRYKGKFTYNVNVKFDCDPSCGVLFVKIIEAEPREHESVWLERRQAILVAKAILRKYQPEALT